MTPFAPQREPSGLDALAEVSRQLQANGDVGADEAFMAQLQQHMDEEDSHEASDNMQHNPASLTPEATPPTLNETVDGQSLHTAPSANEQLAEAAMQQSQSNGPRSRKRKASSAPDPTVPNSYLSYYSERPPPAVDPQLQPQTIDLTQAGTPLRDDQTPAFAMGHSGFGLLQRANKSKARGRFSEERRKEVQNVRKKGACLRCRMLKKPCSEGTPCGTCKNIEAARLWKGACIRTRVADEFGLYSTTYFYSKDRAKVFASLNGNEPQAIHGRIEATLFPHSNLYATFPALKTNRAGRAADGLDPDLLNASQGADIYLLSFKTEDTLALKLERYLHAAVMQCIACESSPIMKATLELAAELSSKHEDAMLTKFIHLWVATNLLVSKEPLWTLSYNPHDLPVNDHITVVDGSADDHGASSNTRQHFPLNSEDYDIMHAQLQDAAERYCQKQAKTCLNELERRLLQRQQSSTFLTFLSAVIILNCVERMTALYCSFDPLSESTAAGLSTESSATPEADDAHMKNTTPPDTDAESKVPDRSSDWPLADSPGKIWPQGHKFAKLLQLLLRMRGLPPTIHINDDGTLAIVSNFNKAYPVVINTNSDGGDSQQLLAAEWVHRTGLTARPLWRVQNLSEQELNKQAWGTKEEEGKGAQAWDLKFLAPLLLPQIS